MSDRRPTAVIVLAAGEGTRMRSTRPKPLHLICGRPMVMHVIHALSSVDVERTVVVVGHGAERVTKKVQEQAPSSANVTFVEQPQQRGTGHAAIVGLTAFPEEDLDDTSTVVILPGDAPLLRGEQAQPLLARASGLAGLMQLGAPRQRGTHPRQQLPAVHGLFHIVEGPPAHGFHGGGHVGVPGDEDQRRFDTARQQLGLQFQPAQFGHAQVGENALAVARRHIGRQEGARGRETANLQAGCA